MDRPALLLLGNSSLENCSEHLDLDRSEEVVVRLDQAFSERGTALFPFRFPRVDRVQESLHTNPSPTSTLDHLGSLDFEPEPVHHPFHVLKKGCAQLLSQRW
jgi:hypothetical protein